MHEKSVIILYFSYDYYIKIQYDAQNLQNWIY